MRKQNKRTRIDLSFFPPVQSERIDCHAFASRTYAFLSALALWFGVGAFITDSIKNIAKILLITHAASTVVALLTNGQEVGFAFFIIGLDLILLGLNLADSREQG